MLENGLQVEVKNYPALLYSLKELQTMIGMETLKDSIVKQVIFLIQNDDFGDVMLNTVLYGPPGTGKSKVGRILCNIWMAIGLVGEENSQSDSNESDSPKDRQREYKRIVRETNKSADLLVAVISSLKKRISDEDLDLIQSLNRIHDISINKIYNPTYSFLGLERSVTPSPSKTDLSSFEGEFPDSDLFRVVSREDFIGQYHGHTPIKTLELLKSNLGKVLFIDEAYSLITDEKDIFGFEALSTLNLFMSQHPKEIIVIFAGYKQLMEEGIFKYQPGLQRRCTWVHEIEPYTKKELLLIFEHQLGEWDYSREDSILQLFDTKNFPGYGGDTQKLIFYAKLEHAMESFLSGEKDRILKLKHLELGLKTLKKNQSVKNIPFVSTYHI